MNLPEAISRRRFLANSVAAGSALAGSKVLGSHADHGQALIAITLDLEMSRNFPTWEQTHWDYEKGNLNDETKRWSVEACRRVRQAGRVSKPR